MGAHVIRPAAVAGVFYPGDGAELAASVDRLIAGAESAGPVPKALIAPHAGYRYSGPIAGSAYAQLRGASFRRVVLLGPAHFVAVRGFALPGADAFVTPLGEVLLDEEGVARATALGAVTSPRAHAREHSLEVQLPFLQRVLGDFRLVPLAVGHADAGEVAALLDGLWGGDETLVVISTDLSHYLTWAEARALDATTAAAICALDGAALADEQACGAVPLRGFLAAAARHGLQAERLDLRSSGDTAGDKDRVVGYGAFAFRGRA